MASIRARWSTRAAAVLILGLPAGSFAQALGSGVLPKPPTAVPVAPRPGRDPVSSQPLPPPPDARVRGLTGGLYKLYRGSRGELVKMHRLAARYPFFSAEDKQLVGLIGKLDMEILGLHRLKLGFLSKSDLRMAGIGDSLREALYTALRAGSGGLSSKDAEDRIGGFAAKSDPLATLHDGDAPEPSDALLRFRKVFENWYEPDHI